MNINLEKLEKTPLLFAGLCYVLGVVVVATYLHQFGIATPLNLFRLQYLLAGLWLLLPILLSSLLTGFILCITYPRWSNSSKQPWKMLAKSINIEDRTERKIIGYSGIGGIMLTIYVLHMAADHLSIEWDAFSWIYVFFLAYFLHIGVTFICLVMREQMDAHLKLISSIISAVIILNAFNYIVCFSKLCFPLIAASLGGGKPTLVQLSFKPDAVLTNQLIQSGLPVDRKDYTSKAKLIYATDNELVLLSERKVDKNKKAISIKRDSLNSIVYSGE